LEHEVDPVAFWKVPAAHDAHEVEAAAAEKVPLGQAEQFPAPAADLNEPARQPVQLEAPATVEYCPQAHCVHEVAPEAENVPTGHAWQAPLNL